MMNGKGFGRKRPLPNFMYFAWRDCENPLKTSISIAGHRGRDLNPDPPEYEGVLTTRHYIRCSIGTDPYIKTVEIIILKWLSNRLLRYRLG
jgi:hypothetical protein